MTPRVSPDGNQIAFVDFPNRQRAVLHSSIYLVQSRGGTPAQVLPNDGENEYDPTWSPDGTKLAFGRRTYWETKFIDPNGEVGIIDLATRSVTYLPPAQRHVRMPQWSPDGRYIVCMTVPEVLKPGDGLEIYDFRTNRWSVILKAQSAEWPTWSPDSRWVYYVSFQAGDRYEFYRIRPEGGSPQLIAGLGEFRGTGFFWGWFGFDPEGNPLMLRDAGTDEVFALTLGG